MDTIEYKGFPKPKTVKLSKYEKTIDMIKANYEKKKLLKSWDIPKNKRVKPLKKVLRKKRVKLPSTRSLILKSDRLFSLFIRERDKKCVLCGTTTALTCGHLIKRGKKSVRWDETNCHCLCSGCNWRDNFDHDIYVAWFIRNYGELPYLDLVEKSRGIFKPSREFLNNIIEKYKV